MSRTTVCIERIKTKLDSISGLDGIVADMLEIEEKHITNLVDLINVQFSEASIFNYKGVGHDDNKML